MRPPTPPLSHLQALALATLAPAEQAGRHIRKRMAQHGVRHTMAAFYQMMARLERDGYVEGWYQPVTVGDQTVTERWYRITDAGARAWRRTRAFYDALVTDSATGLSRA